MTAHNPALEWWETDPRSPGRLDRSNIVLWSQNEDYPELMHFKAFGFHIGVYSRPMFEVLPQ